MSQATKRPWRTGESRHRIDIHGNGLNNIAYLPSYENDTSQLISEANAKLIVKCVNHQDELVEALRLILPLAKGYSASHPVGSNDKYVSIAEEVLAKIQEE